MIEIKSFKNINPTQWKEVKEIFFETSPRKSFQSVSEKDSFLYQYLEYYSDHYPGYFLIAIYKNKAIGYICASPDSNSDVFLLDNLPHFKLFQKYFIDFPAHLHINMSEASQGLGVGSRLVSHLESLLQVKKGLHLITTPKAKNRSFYSKNGYSIEIIREYNGVELLFMGKSLKC